MYSIKTDVIDVSWQTFTLLIHLLFHNYGAEGAMYAHTYLVARSVNMNVLYDQIGMYRLTAEDIHTHTHTFHTYMYRCGNAHLSCHML